MVKHLTGVAIRKIIAGKDNSTVMEENMYKSVIHIYGASGSGTSTLGRFLSEQLGYIFMDTDDYFWLPTNPKYTKKREKTDRLQMIKLLFLVHLWIGEMI
jgi:cytidylate kinase